MNKELLKLYTEKKTLSRKKISESSRKSVKNKTSRIGKKDFVKLKSAEPTDLPPLDEDGIYRLKAALNKEPDKVLRWARRAIDSDITLPQLKKFVYDAEQRVKNKPLAASELRSTMKFIKEFMPLPKGFNFTGMNLKNYPINPGITKFETRADADGWILFAGPTFLFPKEKFPFRWHDNPAYAVDNFIYRMNDPDDDKDLEIGLFADFGTGLYQSTYIAKYFLEKKYPYVIHLGDVYYAGRQSEFDEQFIKYLDPLQNHSRIFTINSNHEMYAGSRPYFEYIDKRFHTNREFQQQRGSYFCLRSSKFQVIAIDTDYFVDSRFKNEDENSKQYHWLVNRLNEGRALGLTNILLSANEPFEYEESKSTKLFSDLKGLLTDQKLVDLWFWGNTHYCALFDQSNNFPFIGSCIGHGGYPYYTQTKEDNEAPTPVRFIETKSRFWGYEDDPREDMGNNGFCQMNLKSDGSIGLKYIDWRRNLRCEVMLSKVGGVLQIISCNEFDNINSL